MGLCLQSDVSAFKNTVWVCYNFSSKEQAPFTFMVAVTIHSDFGAQENKVPYKIFVAINKVKINNSLSLKGELVSKKAAC